MEVIGAPSEKFIEVLFNYVKSNVQERNTSSNLILHSAHYHILIQEEKPDIRIQKNLEVFFGVTMPTLLISSPNFLYGNQKDD